MKTKVNKGTFSPLSDRELDVLKWVQEGKTNKEIGEILGKSVWAIKYHMKNIMTSLEVTNRTQAVRQAIGRGLLSPADFAGDEPSQPTLKVGIVGCGRGGTAILEVLKENPMIYIAGIAEKDPNASGLKVAQELDIPIVKNHKKLVEIGLDVVINLTGSEAVEKELRKIKPDHTELMGGLSAMLMWQLADERRKRYAEKEKVLREHETLYHLGTLIESIDSMNDAGYSLVDYATKLLNMPAGSMAIFDEKKEDMKLVASKGFSSEFEKIQRWTIRKGGLTSFIFNQTTPYFLADLKSIPNPNPLLIKEGVRCVLATPLIVEGRIIGILYVNDFKPRKIRAEDMSIFSLIAVYAALTIERVKSIEDMRLLTIVDGLTGLYNHRHIMEELHKEFERASRHNTNFSVIMMDIDHFKQYNDNFGHIEGNRVLKDMSSLFVKTARVTDIVGRFGGEEFCILAPSLDKKNAVNFANRILKEVSSHKFPKRKVTLSGGVATYPEDGKGALDLIERADQRLYEAKNGGRNRISS